MTEPLHKPVVRLPDPKTVATSLSRISQTARRIVTEYLDRQARQTAPEPPPSIQGTDGIRGASWSLTQKLLANPGKLFEVQVAFWKDYWSLWERTTRRLMGAEVEPVISPTNGDRRFTDPQWAENASNT